MSLRRPASPRARRGCSAGGVRKGAALPDMVKSRGEVRHSSPDFLTTACRLPWKYKTGWRSRNRSRLWQKKEGTFHKAMTVPEIAACLDDHITLVITMYCHKEGRSGCRPDGRTVVSEFVPAPGRVLESSDSGSKISTFKKRGRRGLLMTAHGLTLGRAWTGGCVATTRGWQSRQVAAPRGPKAAVSPRP
jgi:hypothetical protein